MTSKAIRKKVIEYLNHAEDNVVEAVYKLLKIYEDGEGESKMSSGQKSVIEERSVQYRQGKLKADAWSEVKKRTRSK